MMKKKMMLLAAVTLAAGMLSACGKDAEYLSEIKASDYVTLGEYRGIEVTQPEPEVTDEYVDGYIEYLRSQRSVAVEVTDRTTVQEGDTVNIDYAGYRDGVAFEGGTAQGASLTIGSGQFIPGFEEGLIGADVGGTVTLELSFPADYEPNPDLAGAAVTFDVTVNSISIMETPDLTDELVQGFGIEECSTVEELRAYVRDAFYAEAVSLYEDAVASDITQAVMANCIFSEPPEKMVKRYQDMLVGSMTAQAASYGVNLDTFMLNYYNMDTESYMAVFLEDAVTMAEQYIMFQAIADAEGLNLTEDEIAAAMEEEALNFGYESVEAFQEEVGGEVFYEYLISEEVMEFLKENAVIKAE
ncbi:MAG: trigger factor [Blautia sp.]|nr:trigger factor [Blautia sp.]MCM1201448.1 trigger factor [Bacteroides fragilis]